MLVTEQDVRRDRRVAWCVALSVIVVGTALAIWLTPIAWLCIPIGAAFLWWWPLESRRRRRALQTPFPKSWRSTLVQQVDFYNALDDKEKTRFENLMKVFLDEVAVTGVRTDVDAQTLALVGASAVIPIFGFEDWEYAGLGEVLIYPGSFGADYATDAESNPSTLGMIGVNHLSGVMILSKPALIAGFQSRTDKRNVGIHEFAHLVDKRDGSVDGVPPTIDPAFVDPWVRWVGDEMRDDGASQSHIDDYAYTNEAEYFAVLSEYFFEAPAMLKQKSPKLYDMMQSMYHQNTRRRFQFLPRRRRRVGRNDPCPCGSGEKYKRCCRVHTR